MREFVATHWPGYRHGGAWKLVAMACKIVFLIYFAPRMIEGEFAKFLFWQSAALLGARAASVGLVDELPIRVRGRIEEVRKFWPLLQLLQIVSIVGVTVAWCNDSIMLAGLALVLVLLPGAILEGVIRTWQPGWYERALALPWIAFSAALAIGRIEVAMQMLLLYASALLISQLFVSYAVRLGLGRIDWHELIPERIVSLIGSGSLKMASEFTLLANARAPVLLPVILLGSLQSDRVSLSLAVADALAGLFMVVVNRNYVLYCRTDAKAAHALISGFSIVAAMTILGFLALVASLVFPSLWVVELEPMELLWACMLFGAITAYYDARYFFWARGAGVQGSILLQLMAIIGQAGIVLAVPTALQLPAIAGAMTVSVLLFGGILLTKSGHVRARG